MNTRYNEILSYFPQNLRRMLGRGMNILEDSLQEIRIRSRLPLILGTTNGNFTITPEGELSPAVGGAYIVKESDVRQIFTAICENSVYAFMEDIKQGFVTIKGGHRVGIAGRAVNGKGGIENFREISSLNIRVAREVVGAANYIIGNIQKDSGIVNTLIVSPPMGGKTTVLRDLARQISDSGIKTALADDRGELAAIFRGVPQNDIGLQTDVIENAPKSQAVVMMLRSMSPQLIVTDKIATKEDIEAVLKCFGTGVSVIASTHGKSAEEVLKRENLRQLFSDIGFGQIIVLQKEGKGINTKILGEVTKIRQEKR